MGANGNVGNQVVPFPRAAVPCVIAIFAAECLCRGAGFAKVDEKAWHGPERVVKQIRLIGDQRCRLECSALCVDQFDREGDVILIRPGTSIPADGIVIDGSSAVNEAMITEASSSNSTMATLMTET